MTKTANHDEETPKPPPSDIDIVRNFLAEATTYSDHAKIAPNDPEYWRAVGHAQARQDLAQRLEDGKRARRQYVKEAGDRIVKAAEKAGHAVADFLNATYAKAEERADQDRK